MEMRNVVSPARNWIYGEGESCRERTTAQKRNTACREERKQTRGPGSISFADSRRSQRGVHVLRRWHNAAGTRDVDGERLICATEAEEEEERPNPITPSRMGSPNPISISGVGNDRPTEY